MSYHARRAETALLDAIAAVSVATTAPGGLGAGRELIARAAQAAAAYRSRHRMAPTAVLDALFPSWAVDLVTADVARGREDYGTVTAADVEGWLRQVGIRAGWYRDSKTGGAQVIGSQGTGVLLTFPTTMLWYLHAPGTFAFLDGGTLDFGLTWDSALNTRNAHRLMVETFEGLAYLGVQSVEISQAVCADDSGGADRTLTCPV
jgi:hypothetical protein